jgi:protein-L-isoaspartate(D-aspartate) O-methyltransferase
MRVGVTEAASGFNHPRGALPSAVPPPYKRDDPDSAQDLAEAFMTFDFRAARLTMVESQVRTADVTDLAITDAMRTVARESLCPPPKAPMAYADAEIEYAPGLWLMRPRDIGKLLQALHPRPLERALAVAAPYAAAVMAAMGLEVVSCGPELDGGAAAGAFDVIVTEGAVAEVPQAWLDRLAEGGRLGAVIRNGPVGKAHLYMRQDGPMAVREVFDATPPYLPGLQPQAHFAL